MLGHIRGAVSLPVTDFETLLPEKRRELPSPDEEIVCYCSGYGCEESVELADKLKASGYRHVFVYLGGWPEWSEAQLPSETSLEQD